MREREEGRGEGCLEMKKIGYIILFRTRMRMGWKKWCVGERVQVILKRRRWEKGGGDVLTYP